MKERTCETCRCFHRTGKRKDENGECRFMPPTRIVVPRQDVVGGKLGYAIDTGFPVVSPGRWCFQYKPKMEAVRM